MSTTQPTPRRTPYVDSKGNRAVGIYTRQTKAGDTVFEVGFKENGKQKWRTVEGGITAAKTARATELARIAKGDRTGSGDLRLTFSKAADTWWEAHSPSCRPNTVSAYKLALRHLRAEFGPKRLARITPDDVARYVRVKQREGLKGWTVRSQLSVLGQIFKFASRRLDFGGQNPVALLSAGERPGSDDAKEQRILTPDEVARLIAAIPESYRAIYTFAAYTGARLGEVLGLTWASLDLSLTEPMVSFTHQLDRAGQRVPLKTKRSRRTIEIAPELAADLRRIKLASAHSGRHDFVFAMPTGKPHSHSNIAGRLLWKAIEDAGLEAVERDGIVIESAPSFHSLRHWHGSMLIADGWDIADVSARLGHSDVTTTLRVYTHQFDRLNRGAARRESLGRLMAPAAPGTVRQMTART